MRLKVTQQLIFLSVDSAGLFMLILILKLDLESIGTSLGIDWEIIWSGVEWSGPAIRPGLDNRNLIILTPHTCL